MKLPPPPRSTRFANCMWLDRIVSKLRLKASGELPPEYVYAVGAKTGAFLRLPGVTTETVTRWNEIAVNLGREGYPMAGIVPRALAGPYSNVKGEGLETVFDVLEADEGLC